MSATAARIAAIPRILDTRESLRRRRNINTSSESGGYDRTTAAGPEPMRGKDG
jgi:hypothetical protein